jgi:amino acid adenylation domain-containing protein
MALTLLHETFEQNVLKYPEKIAVQEEKAAVSYEQLHKETNTLVTALFAAGLQRHDIAAVLLPPGINWVAAMLGLFRAGMVYLPLSNTYPDKKIANIYTQTRFKGVIVAQSYLSKILALLDTLPDPDIAVLVWLEDNSLQLLRSAREGKASMNKAQGTDCDYIIYTSGSTGAGKPIAGSLKGLSHFINWQRSEFRIDQHCRVGQLTSMVFDASFRDVFLPLAAGGAVYIPGESTRTNMVLLAQWLHLHQVQLIHCVPAVWKLMTKQLEQTPDGARLLNSLRHVFLAGEPLYVKDIMKWRELMGTQCEIINLYGTSETTMAKTFYRVGALRSDPAQLVPVGKPIDNTVVAVINNKALCSPGELGEIYIKTPYWSNGYYNDEALTSTVFVQNPLISDHTDIVYRTGDLGRYLEDGNMEVIGRVDDQVKINGVRVELREIEQAVLRMPGMRETVIKTRTDADGNQELTCYYADRHITGEEIRNFLRTELTDNLVPTYFVALSEWPLTINGKINKRALPEPEEVNGHTAMYELPQGRTEQLIEGIWKEVLYKTEVSRHAPFFMIGGNSLKAIQVVSRISNVFKVQVKVAEIFSHQTIASLARFVEQAVKGAPEEIPVCEAHEHYELSHAQKRLWTLYRLEPHSYAYNIPMAFWLEGEIDMAAMSQSVEFVARRHEILRTNFMLVEAKPKQHIHPVGTISFPLGITDLRNEPDAGKKLDRLLNAAAAEPFDLTSDRLLRVHLYRLAAAKYVFFLNMHHIIADRWSEEILLEELLQAYSAFKEHREITWPPLRIQYKDFAAWHNHKISQPSSEEHRNYWVAQLEGNITELPLPLDFPRPDVRTPAGGAVSLELDTTRSRQLLSLTAQHSTGPFALLLAAISTLVYQLTGCRQMIIGTPWTCRDHQELERQLGFYVNTVAICLKVDPQQAFTQLLQEVKERVLQAARHQDYPFDLLTEELRIRRKPNRSPVFDIGFTWHDQVNITPVDKDLIIKPYELEFTGMKADLWFHGIAEHGNIRLSVEYSHDLFRESTAHMLLEALERILDSVVQSPDAIISSIATAIVKVPATRNIPGIEFTF